MNTREFKNLRKVTRQTFQNNMESVQAEFMKSVRDAPLRDRLIFAFKVIFRKF